MFTYTYICASVRVDVCMNVLQVQRSYDRKLHDTHVHCLKFHIQTGWLGSANVLKYLWISTANCFYYVHGCKAFLAATTVGRLLSLRETATSVVALVTAMHENHVKSAEEGPRSYCKPLLLQLTFVYVSIPCT